jgi:hypothetical protein
MVGLARLGLVMIFGWLDWHCMVGFVADFGMVGLALYGWVWYWFLDDWTSTIWFGLVLTFAWLNFVLIF